MAVAVERAVRMVAEGADIVDIGGESTRPGHAPVSSDEEAARVVDVVAAVRAALPDVPISIDTRKAAVAEAALDAGADIVNDVAAVSARWRRSLASRPLAGVPYVITHDRAAPRLGRHRRRRDGGSRGGRRTARSRRDVARASLIVDPGIGFGKDAAQNLALLRGLARLARARAPGAAGCQPQVDDRSRPRPASRRARSRARSRRPCSGIAAGVDIVRVHDVEANVRAARMADAVVRGWEEVASRDSGPDGGASNGRIALRGMRFEGRHGVSDDERAYPQVIEVDLELEADLDRAARSDDLGDTVDYGPLVELTRAVVEDRSFRLLEGIAGALLDAVMAAAPAAHGASRCASASWPCRSMPTSTTPRSRCAATRGSLNDARLGASPACATRRRGASRAGA